MEVGQVIKVVNGPPVWVDKLGDVLKVKDDEVLLRISGSDDCGQSVYDVWMPKTCVTLELKEKIKA
jgi:hypothetical protein